MFERLSDRLVGTDERYLYFPAAPGTCNHKGDWLTHYSLSNRGDHGIDVVQPAVKYVKALFKLSDILVAFSHGCLL